MVIKGAEVYSIEFIHNNSILSKDGTISLVYCLEQPRRYSLTDEDYDVRCDELDKAFRQYPNNTIIHKQDIYTNEAFNGASIERDSFLGIDSQDHFNNRLFIAHKSYIIFSLYGLSSLSKSYQSNPFAFKEALHKRDLEAISNFENAITRSLNIIRSLKDTNIRALTENETTTYIREIANGFEQKGFYDTDFREQVFGNHKYFEMLTINRAEQLPNELSNIRKSPKSRDFQPVWEGFFDGIGEVLPFDHVVNQLIYFEGKDRLLGDIERSRKIYGKFKKLNAVLESQYKHLETIYNKHNFDDNELIHYHINILTFSKTKAQTQIQLNKIKQHLDTIGIKGYYQPKSEVLQNLYLASIPSRSKILHKDFKFISTLLQATFLFTHTSVSKTDSEGVYFNCPITQKPLLRDIWDEGNRLINARNGIIVAQTGSGKSVLCLSIMTQFLEQGISVVVAEFGRSFEYITKLYPDTAKHIVLKVDTPLGINPFEVSDPKKISKEKIEYLISIVLKTWRMHLNEVPVIVALETLIKEFYNEKGIEHSYESFYNYVVGGGENLLRFLNIKLEYFDLDSFKHNCEQFTTGGRYENVFKVGGEQNTSIGNKQLVVFELTEIKKDPFLVTLVLLILQDTIDSNILSDRTKKGILIFDEFAETAGIKDIYGGEEILQTVATLYQKIRKENGAVYIIIQDLVQLPKNNHTEGIYANNQLFYVLPSSRSSYDKIADTLKLTSGELAELRSIKNNYSNQYPYSEFWLKRGEHTEVLRNEISKASFYAFQTKGDLWQQMNEKYQVTQNLEISIKEMIQEQNT